MGSTVLLSLKETTSNLNLIFLFSLRKSLIFFTKFLLVLISLTCDPFDLISSLVSLSNDLICKSIDLRFKSLSPRIELVITYPFFTINLFSNKSGDTKT